MIIKDGRDQTSTIKEVEETQHHFHNIERWFGVHGAPSATRWGTVSTLGAYNVFSGDNTWGPFASILGSSDTPVLSGKKYFDPHQIMVVDVSHSTKYRFRMLWGAATTTALANGDWSETILKFDELNPQQSAGIPFMFKSKRIAAGTKVWAQTWNVTNGATVDLFVGIHEYHI